MNPEIEYGDNMNPEIDKYGHKFWYDSDGKCHREDGPAIEWVDGSKWWYRHGLAHREDGPAYEGGDGRGYKLYYLKDILFTEKEYWEKIKELKKCKLFKFDKGKIGWI